MFSDFIHPLQRQADIMAKGNPDLKQDILAMSFDSYQRARERGNNLSVGELVNFMKYRAGSLRSGERLSFGNRSTKTTNDVYHKANYFNGQVEILSLNYQNGEEEIESPADGRGMFNEFIATKEFTNEVLFRIGFEDFLDQQSLLDQKILQMRHDGYTLNEIAQATGLSKEVLYGKLHQMKLDFLMHFELPAEYG